MSGPPRPGPGLGAAPSWAPPRRVRIRTKLLLVNAFLVLVPLLGLSFARTYERELLRSEEEGLVAVAAALSAGLAEEPGALVAGGAGPPGPWRDADVAGRWLWQSPRGPQRAEPRGLPAFCKSAALGAAQRLRARVRVLDTGGAVLLDTGPEHIKVLTRGRQLLSREDAPRKLVVGDPEPAGPLRERAEVARALSGARGRASRTEAQLRGVRLYVAEPIRAPVAGAAGGAPLGAVYVSRTTYPVLVSLYRVRNGLYRVGALSLGVALVLALFLGLTISRPLRRLTEAARRLAGGERGVALDGLPLRGRDEIGELARAFDVMSRELDARLSYISELAANVSHEFKTPIASIRGAAELLRDGAADDPAARARFLSNIDADCERLSRLVTRLLQLSRIESQREPAVPLDYRALTEQVVARYAEGGVQVSLSYTARYAHLRGSEEQLASALSNLIDNAVRFSPADRPLVVRVLDDEGGALRTEVQDQGPGISAANLLRVWDRFFTTARGQGGTGLGLSIVRAAVEAHGGRTGAVSQPGAGSTFYFVLPRRL